MYTNMAYLELLDVRAAVHDEEPSIANQSYACRNRADGHCLTREPLDGKQAVWGESKYRCVDAGKAQ